jgi:2-polyprenyl-3-methyl-5-hydroxy-6-metoxy-1,4-benzoquinol methylase
MNLKSPIDRESDVQHLRDIKVKEIVSLYKSFNIDVTKYFHDLEIISVFKCERTNYEFYYPFNLEGDSAFYEHFQSFDWYYMPWKWEHKVTMQYINNGMNILEVGCGHGAFLNKVSELYNLNDCVGLEINQTALKISSKWKIVNQFVQDYEIDNKEKFDLVCSYQVLEHVSDVFQFITSKINCLKPGGKLIISLPNNESFLKNSNFCLNMPPHHMGKWDSNSLTALEKLFSINLIKLHYEELQEYHIDSYIYSKYYAKYNRLFGKIVRKIDRMTGKYNKLIKYVKTQKNNIIGHTILAVFEKKVS